MFAFLLSAFTCFDFPDLSIIFLDHPLRHIMTFHIMCPGVDNQVFTLCVELPGMFSKLDDFYQVQFLIDHGV